jgi:twitching motility protein PilT
VLSSLHTMGAAKTIDRIVDIFPSQQQEQIRVQLAMSLVAVVSQQLVPTVDKGLAAAFEVMICNTAISTNIRENNLQMINSTIHTSAKEGMQTMESSLAALAKKGKITKDTAMLHSERPEIVERLISI